MGSTFFPMILSPAILLMAQWCAKGPSEVNLYIMSEGICRLDVHVGDFCDHIKSLTRKGKLYMVI